MFAEPDPVTVERKKNSTGLWKIDTPYEQSNSALVVQKYNLNKRSEKW